ncbi:helix-turn-helix domain-containing protein [Micromonospora humi]|uniref:Helix-turn-helix domain-containing protein n=1 Tax=Micromonospora humi TaxID=745366 RepID=A0A1C5K5J9_9ACTN|nr:helix-turn-helix domain-containing protein [Micromonospora humi]SCG78072.1 Helix-turn-helix domain-containing protein [Micromonospora humi]
MEMSRERWAETALHPVRIRILRAVAGSRLTTHDLVELLPDIPQATLYRHLALLVRTGLLDVVEQRRVRGTAERVYALPAHSATLDASALATATPEDHARYFTSFVSSLLSEFSRYLSRERIDLVADGVGYQQLVLHLTDAELAEFAAGFNALVGPLLSNEPGDGRTPRLLATVLMPADRPTPTGHDERQPGPTDGSTTTGEN